MESSSKIASFSSKHRTRTIKQSWSNDEIVECLAVYLIYQYRKKSCNCSTTLRGVGLNESA